MEINEFFECVRKRTADYYGEGYNVTLNKVTKNNGLVLTGLVVMENDKNIAPTIYLNDLYKDYKSGKAIEDIVKYVTDIYEHHKECLDFDFSIFTDYYRLKEKIMYRLLNYDANKELLRDVPHKRYMDLAIVFYVMIENESIGNGSVLIHNNHMDSWRVNEDELYEAAINNTPKKLQYRFSSMENIVEEMFGTGECTDALEAENVSIHNMYVLTNTRKIFGASCLLYDGLIERISDKLKSSLYIIPSSIHELIIIPKKEYPDSREDLIEMVRCINATELETVDILSDNVYEYSYLTGEMLY